MENKKIIYIDSQTHKRFKMFCLINDLKMSDGLTLIVNQYLNEQEEKETKE